MKYVPPDLGDTADNSAGHADTKTKIKNALSVVIVLGALYIGLGFLAELVAHYIPESYEAKLGGLTPDPPDKDTKEFKSYQRANQIFEKLLSTNKMRDLPYSIFLLDIEVPNAFAVPGGGIGVTSALLEKVKSEIGLAMVIGHEFGHHQYRHTVKRMGRAILYQTVVGILFGGSGSSFAELTVNMGELNYSRDQETEADEFGIELVKNAYGTTEGALEFFEMVEREKLGVSKKWQSMFTTHPYTPDRIEHIKSKMK